MPTLEIIKAWKDEEYRDTLAAEQGLEVPKHPSGLIEFQQDNADSDGSFEGMPAACASHTCFLTKTGGHCCFTA